MVVDKMVFFQEATLRISGSLDIEKALWQCLMYFREIMPAEHISLSLYNHEVGVGEIFANASPEGGQIVSIKTHLSETFRTEVIKHQSKEIRIVKRMEDYEGTREGAKMMNIEDSSCLVMDLIIESKFLGLLLLVCKKNEQFTREHINLLGLLNKPFALALTNSIRFRELKRIKDWLADENQFFQEELRQIAGKKVIGADSGLKKTMKMVHQVAPLDSPVLLLGETGVGKELIAGAIHYSSARHDRPLIKVNCGAIPESLMDSELFGHEKGAFTGAITRQHGRFERAHRGTIFLDEIGELSMDAQVRLLRVLQEKEIERVGGSETIKVDIRLIAATHRNMKKMLEEGRFREDLYFRLNVFPITIPPLRNRIDDIPKLIDYFILKKSREMKRIDIAKVASGVVDRLISYNWPGNVRELENAVERSLILSEGKPLTFDDIEFKRIQPSEFSTELSEFELMNYDKMLFSFYQKALRLTEGKVEGKGGAAELLGVNPRTLRHRMRKIGVPFGRSLS